MFKQHNVITAVELGTSKICVLIGEYTDDELTIIGRGESAVDNAIVKGEILDMDLVQEKLIDAMDQAALSGIAKKYHTSVKAICKLNGIKETTVLQIGRKLKENEA